MPFNNNTKTDIQIRRFTFRIVIVFLLAITVATGTITLILTRKSSQEMKSKVVNLIQANTQLQISNLNQYLGRIEDTAALLFSDDIYCEYDATKEGQDAFEKIQQETAIENVCRILIFFRTSLILELYTQMIHRLVQYRIRRSSCSRMVDYMRIWKGILRTRGKSPAGFSIMSGAMTGCIT